MIGGPKFSNWAVIGEFFSRWKSFAFLLVLLAPLELLARGAGREDRLFYRSFCVVSLAAIIQCLYYAAFSTWSVWPWYSYLVALDMAIVAARIVYLGAAIIDTPGARLAAIAAVALLGTWTVYRSGMFIERSLPAQVRSHLPAMLGGGRAAIAKRSFNDVSLSMLDDFFASRPHTVIAMGDRAGGLAYWGRSNISLVQTEGLTLDAGYIRARLADRGAEYLASRYPIEYLVIDREHVPTIKDADGESEFVIPEPIQGRISTDPVPTFCFPPSAVRYEQAYAGDYGTNRRLAFAFGARVQCSAAALAFVRSAGTSLGLRRFSLPSEYLR
jgi:hypothetical protein